MRRFFWLLLLLPGCLEGDTPEKASTYAHGTGYFADFEGDSCSCNYYPPGTSSPTIQFECGDMELLFYLNPAPAKNVRALVNFQAQFNGAANSAGVAEIEEHPEIHDPRDESFPIRLLPVIIHHMVMPAGKACDFFNPDDCRSWPESELRDAQLYCSDAFSVNK